LEGVDVEEVYAGGSRRPCGNGVGVIEI
jgi:hypothetical protein